MSNIKNLVEQSKGMPAFAAVNYLSYHRFLQERKYARLLTEIRATEEAIDMIKEEVKRRKQELEEKKAQCQS